MKYLFTDWKNIERIIKESPRVLLLADYDGTLTPIASKPEDAVLNKIVKNTLRVLLKKNKFYVGIISGRRLSDIKRLIGLKKIYYSGNHGLEIEGPGLKFVHAAYKRFRPYLLRIKKELFSKTKHIRGVIIEYKAGSISLHYRLVKKRFLKTLRSIFHETCDPHLKRGKIRLSSGKRVWEVRIPVDWNKGDAVGKILRFLNRKKGLLTVYLGDDVTDEDAFSFLKRKKAITIFIGKRKKSLAGYYLRSPNEAKRFLMRLCLI